MKIFINAGHGGTDPGACSKSGTREADITLKVANILVEKLKANYYPVEFYQQKNSYLEISKQENKSGATLFISLHCNSSVSKEAHGIETLFRAGSTKGEELARIVQNELIKATELTSRGVKSRDDLHVLNRTKAPAILIELAFLSNPAEESILKKEPELFANAIWKAIKIYKAKSLI